jgi:hypothetical protein
MFIPLTHAPGEAQADFGEALVVVAGVEQKAHYLAMDLPHSDDCFVAAFPAETTEAFLEGHVRAFVYFGAVPTRILYDNTKIAVARILGGEERQKTRAFSELQSYYLFADKFGRPAKGNDKGKVEGLVGYARRNFMVPIPRVSSWEELNTRLEAESRKRRLRRLRGHTETIGERFERDHRAMLPLPAAPYEACEKITGRVSSPRCPLSEKGRRESSLLQGNLRAGSPQIYFSADGNKWGENSPSCMGQGNAGRGSRLPQQNSIRMEYAAFGRLWLRLRSTL